MIVHPQLFATVFGVIFLAELPDKTALAALVLATRHRPLPVFFGASLALTAQSVIAVVAGSLLARLPNAAVHVGAGLLFIGCAVLMWIRKPDEHDTSRWSATASTTLRRSCRPRSGSRWAPAPTWRERARTSS